MKQLKHSLVLVAVVLGAASSVLAADKSGVSPNTISLPTGPGSIQGLGEAFQPTLNTGTGKQVLALQVPPAAAGHTPSLQLSYEGGSGNGPVGIGWNLPLAYVQRQCDKGIPRYVDGANGVDDDRDGTVDEANEIDVFISELKEELVPQEGGDHFCENESAFVRYRRIGEHWEGTLPNGTRLEFGLSAEGRVTDPTSSKPYRWLLEKSTDTHGNTITYTYSDFPGEENLNQKYLTRVAYGPGAPPWDNLHVIAFSYEPRSDWFEDCRSGFPIRTGQRLSQISIATQGPELVGHQSGDVDEDGIVDYLNRRYNLDYDAHPHWSLLSGVTLFGADGSTALPSQRYGYTGCNDDEVISASGLWIGAENEPLWVMDNPLVDLIDLNGDGLPDILKTDSNGGVHRGYINQGQLETENGKVIAWKPFEELESVDARAWNVDLEAASGDITHLSDMDGDGLADLVYTSQVGDVYYFKNEGTLGWGTRELMSVEDSAPPSPFGNADVKTADIDFDKRVDIVQSLDIGGTAGYRVWLNQGDQKYSRSFTVEQVTAFQFSQKDVKLRDFNGDRVPDLVRIGPTALIVQAGLGYGRFATPRSVSLSGWQLESGQIERARLEDVTGDGLADLVVERAQPGQLWFWVNLGNYSLTNRRLLSGLPAPVGEDATTRWADLNGNGTTDLVYADRLSAPRLLTVDLGELMGCVPRPHLLRTVENGLGRKTTINYLPSTHYALLDAAKGTPWQHPLPFPVSVISAIHTEDSLGNSYVAEFDYHDGYYDAEEKEFRGFARVERIDVGDVTAPTLVTRSHFSTGREIEALKGKTLRVTVQEVAGAVFSDKLTTWVARTLKTGVDGKDVVYAHSAAETRHILERGHGTPRLLEKEFTYDDYGNRTKVRDYGVVLDEDRSAFDDERVTTTQFALNLDAWVLRKPMRQEIADEHGAVLSRVEYYYDDPTFGAANPGLVTKGDLSLEREWVDSGDAQAFVASKRVVHDVYGNPILLLDPLADAPGGVVNAQVGHYREVVYDVGFHTYPEREVIHVGGGADPLVAKAAYDEGFGTVTASVDFNDQLTTYGYDAFARPVHVVKPNDTVDYPTAEYDYALAEPFGDGGLINYVETRSLDRAPGTAGTHRDHYLIRRSFVDGLGRILLQKEEAEPHHQTGHPRVVAHGATVFNARRKKALVLGPFYTRLSGGDLDDLLAFEDVRAAGWEGFFHENGALVALDLQGAHTTATIYDATLRVTETTEADGHSRRVVYEPLVTRNFDENDNDPGSPHHDTPHVFYSDGLGRLLQTDEVVPLNPDGTPAQSQAWSTVFTYDLNDRLTQITDALGNVKTMSHDGLRRQVFMDDPDRGQTTYEFDAASNLVRRTDNPGTPKEQVTEFAYDGANRVLSEDFLDDNHAEISLGRSPDVTYHYDTPEAEFAARHVKGRLAYVEDLGGAEYHSYDERGNSEWTSRRIDARDGSRSFLTERAYDSLDRVVATTYPDGETVSYLYNNRGLLEAIPGFLVSLSYLPSGQLESEHVANGVVCDRAYNKRQWLVQLRSETPATNSVLQDYTYDFDGVGNVHGITEALGLEEDPASADQLFSYDALYRLTEAQSPAYGAVHYRYSAIGNLLERSAASGDARVDLGTYEYGTRIDVDGAGPHAVTETIGGTHAGVSLTYDSNGNYRSRDDWTYAFDFRDRLFRAEKADVGESDPGRVAEYRYDHRSRRVLKRVLRGGSVEETLYPFREFEVRHGKDVKYIFAGDRRLARVETPALIHYDRTLPAGWSFFSLPLEPETPQLASVLASLEGKWIGAAVIDNSGASQFLPASDPAATTLEVHAGTVLAVYLNDTAELSVLGLPPLTLAPLGLDAGWHVVGGSTFGGESVLELEDQLGVGFDLWSYDSESDLWRSYSTGGTAFLNTLTALASDGAYWLRLDAPVTLERKGNHPPGTFFYHPDHLGSSNFVTGELGTVVETTEFYPFGVERHNESSGDFQAAYRYTGQEKDAETGLMYYGARYYDAEVGRFVSPDPLYTEIASMGAEKRSALLGNPQKLSLYSYVLNNPLRYNDPSGLQETPAKGFDPLDATPALVAPMPPQIGGPLEVGVDIYQGATAKTTYGVAKGWANAVVDGTVAYYVYQAGKAGAVGAGAAATLAGGYLSLLIIALEPAPPHPEIVKWEQEQKRQQQQQQWYDSTDVHGSTLPDEPEPNSTPGGTNYWNGDSYWEGETSMEPPSDSTSSAGDDGGMCYDGCYTDGAE